MLPYDVSLRCLIERLVDEREFVPSSFFIPRHSAFIFFKKGSDAFPPLLVLCMVAAVFAERFFSRTYIGHAPYSRVFDWH